LLGAFGDASQLGTGRLCAPVQAGPLHQGLRTADEREGSTEPACAQPDAQRHGAHELETLGPELVVPWHHKTVVPW
jgi:hypothetical protein